MTPPECPECAYKKMLISRSVWVISHLRVSSAIFSEPHLAQDTLALRDIFAPTVSCTQATSARTLALKSNSPLCTRGVRGGPP